MHVETLSQFAHRCDQALIAMSQGWSKAWIQRCWRPIDLAMALTLLPIHCSGEVRASGLRHRRSLWESGAHVHARAQRGELCDRPSLLLLRLVYPWFTCREHAGVV